MTFAPEQVEALAAERAAARVARDWARADALREEIAALGWVVRDVPDGYELTERPPYDVLASVADLPDRAAAPDDHRLTVSLLVEGWPEDLRTCVDALLAHAPDDARLVLLDLGDVDGAGAAVHEYATAHPDRVVAFHVAADARRTGWAAARTALLRNDSATYHAVMDVSSVLEGDAFGPLLAALDADPGVVAAGWRGADVDLADNWRSVVDAGPGEVDVLLSYLMVVRRSAAIATPPDPAAAFYRNADLEWSLLLREAGGRLVVPDRGLPVRQDRHRGYHDSDPAYREKQSRKTYDRLLRRFRGHEDLLAPRSPDA